MKISLLFRVTGAAIFLQVALGGLLTFGLIDSMVHIAVGAIAFILAILTLAVVATAKPRPRQLMGLSIGQVLLFIVQIVLGFSTLGSGSSIVAWVHFITAMGIFGMAISGTFMAMRVEATAQRPSVITAT